MEQVESAGTLAARSRWPISLTEPLDDWSGAGRNPHLGPHWHQRAAATHTAGAPARIHTTQPRLMRVLSSLLSRVPHFNLIGSLAAFLFLSLYSHFIHCRRALLLISPINGPRFLPQLRLVSPPTSPFAPYPHNIPAKTNRRRHYWLPIVTSEATPLTTPDRPIPKTIPSPRGPTPGTLQSSSPTRRIHFGSGSTTLSMTRSSPAS